VRVSIEPKYIWSWTYGSSSYGLSELALFRSNGNGTYQSHSGARAGFSSCRNLIFGQHCLDVGK
jgi:hypothetical protein